jgi:hypothetical protein
VPKAKIRFRAAGLSRDSLKLDLSFVLLRTFDLAQEGLTVSIGPVMLVELPPDVPSSVDEAATLVQKDQWRWVYREKKSAVRTGIRRLKLDTGSGRIALKAKRLDLSALRDAGAADVTVRVTLGEEIFETTLDLTTNGRRKWGYKAVPAGFVPRPPVSVDDPLPPPPGPGPGEKLSFRVLDQGATSGVTTSQNFVLRNATEYASLWTTHRTNWTGPWDPPPPGPRPAVDWSKEIVVAVFTGPKGTAGYQANILNVTASGNGAVVSFEDVQPGPTCVVFQAVTQPFIFIAMTRVAGTVTFKGKIRVQNCP